MRTTRYKLVCLLFFFAMVVHLRGGEVSSATKRQETLNLATRLLAPHGNQTASLPDDLMNPFSPERHSVVKNVGEKKSAGPSDREILEKIASTITPSGMMTIGGKPLLLFRERKLRVGDPLKISLEGVDYVVVLTAIDRTSFRLSLNREEITRPIKPGKTP
jgi:hypothetical protein